MILGGIPLIQYSYLSTLPCILHLSVVPEKDQVAGANEMDQGSAKLANNVQIFYWQ